MGLSWDTGIMYIPYGNRRVQRKVGKEELLDGHSSI
jgi:hypothetical protein